MLVLLFSLAVVEVAAQPKPVAQLAGTWSMEGSATATFDSVWPVPNWKFLPTRDTIFKYYEDSIGYWQKSGAWSLDSATFRSGGFTIQLTGARFTFSKVSKRSFHCLKEYLSLNREGHERIWKKVYLRSRKQLRGPEPPKIVRMLSGTWHVINNGTGPEGVLDGNDVPIKISRDSSVQLFVFDQPRPSFKIDVLKVIVTRDSLFLWSQNKEGVRGDSASLPLDNIQITPTGFHIRRRIAFEQNVTRREDTFSNVTDSGWEWTYAAARPDTERLVNFVVRVRKQR